TTSIGAQGSGNRWRAARHFEARLVPVVQLGQTDLGNPDAGLQLPGLKNCTLTKLYGKPFTHVAQSNPLTPHDGIGRYGVDHAQSQGLAFARYLYTDHDRTGVVRQSMDDGILHQGL